MTVASTRSAQMVAALATEALVHEAELTPKPGLDDRRGGGSHGDMTLTLLRLSARVLEPYFERMAKAATELDGTRLREKLGSLGREAEDAMLSSTGGVNTHRGAIWSLGLLAAAAMRTPCTSVEEVCLEAGRIARIPDRHRPAMQTHGQSVRQRYGIAGAREEAQAGFPSIRNIARPALLANREHGITGDAAALQTLLALMAEMEDTCVLFRGGPAIAAEFRNRAACVLEAGGLTTLQGRRLYTTLDEWTRHRNLSPGGAADLLAATLFLHTLCPSHGGIDEPTF